MPSIFTLTGSVTSTGELRQSQKGSIYLRFEIRANEDELVPIIAFNELANNLAQNLALGQNVIVTGSVHGTRESLNAKYIDTSLFANEVINLNNTSSKNKANNNTQSMKPKKEPATTKNGSTLSQSKVQNGNTFNQEEIQKKLTEAEQKIENDAESNKANKFSDNFNKALETENKNAKIVDNGGLAIDSDRTLNNNSMPSSSTAESKHNSSTVDSETNENAELKDSSHNSNLDFDFPAFQDSSESNDDSFF